MGGLEENLHSTFFFVQKEKLKPTGVIKLPQSHSPEWTENCYRKQGKKGDQLRCEMWNRVRTVKLSLQPV